MLNLLMNIDAGTIDWSRAQFALTAIYHWLFVPLTLGLAVIMGIMETVYYRTGNELWKDMAKFWQKLFGINFAMGVATGIILEFEFGTNWSNYSWFVGDIFGAPLAIEGIVAFFMESTFVAVMFFGWKKVSKGFHLASTWLTGLGATISAWWILVANAWMQNPVGCEFNPDTMRNEMVSFADVVFSSFAVNKFCHTVTSAWIVGAVFCVAVSAWYLLKKREKELALKSMKIGAGVGLVASLLAFITGDMSAHEVAQKQPMKLAAMEALYNGGTDQSLTAVAWVNPFRQADYESGEEPPLRIGIPYALSFLATHDFHGFVPGINDILNGYTDNEGNVIPSVAEKMQRGRMALDALAQYRALKDSEPEAAAAARAILDENVQYMGYGHLEKPEDVVPPVGVVFWAFRFMIGLGMLLLLEMLVLGWLAWKDRLSDKKWLLIAALCCIPLVYICGQSGWVVAEVGRQPWTIQGLLPVNVAISSLSVGAVKTTVFRFLAIFTLFLAIEIRIMIGAIRKGPETENE